MYYFFFQQPSSSASGLFEDADDDGEEDLFATSVSPSVSTDQMKKSASNNSANKNGGRGTAAAKSPSLFGSPNDLFAGGNDGAFVGAAPTATTKKVFMISISVFLISYRKGREGKDFYFYLSIIQVGF